MSSHPTRKQKMLRLSQFRQLWTDEDLDVDDISEIADEVEDDIRKLKRYQQTLKKSAKAYKDINEHLGVLKGLGLNINPPSLSSSSSPSSSSYSSSSNSSVSPPPKTGARKSWRPTAASVAALRSRIVVSSNSSSNESVKPVKKTTKPVLVFSSNSEEENPKPVPVKTASKAPSKAQSKAPVAKPKPKSPSPATKQRDRELKELRAARNAIGRKLERVTKRRSQSPRLTKTLAHEEGRKVATRKLKRSTSRPPTPNVSADVSPSKQLNEFVDVLEDPYPLPEPVRPGYCGKLSPEFVDDWMEAAKIFVDDDEEESYSMYKYKFTTNVKAANGSITVNELPDKFIRTDNAADGTCLIHAFLTAVSPVYRSLSLDNKGILGRAFRQKVYAKLFSDSTTIKIVKEDFNKVSRHVNLGNRIIKGLGSEDDHIVPARKYIEYVGAVNRGGSHGYLYDFDAKKLAQCFNVNIVIVLDNIMNIRFEEDDSKEGKKKPYIFIHQAGAHFTTIHKKDKYIFTYDEVQPVREWVDAARDKDKTVFSSKDRKDYAEGSLVLYKGEPRIIREYVWNEASEYLMGRVKRVTHVKLEDGVRGLKVPIGEIEINKNMVRRKGHQTAHKIITFEMDPATGLVTHLLVEGIEDPISVENIEFV